MFHKVPKLFQTLPKKLCCFCHHVELVFSLSSLIVIWSVSGFINYHKFYSKYCIAVWKSGYKSSYLNILFKLKFTWNVQIIQKDLFLLSMTSFVRGLWEASNTTWKRLLSSFNVSEMFFLHCSRQVHDFCNFDLIFYNTLVNSFFYDAISMELFLSILLSSYTFPSNVQALQTIKNANKFNVQMFFLPCVGPGLVCLVLA